MLDGNVILRLLNNDEKAFGEVYTHYINKLAFAIDTIVRDKDVSEDIAMGIICDVPGTVTEKYADPYDFECWIMCIGRNRAISYLR